MSKPRDAATAAASWRAKYPGAYDKFSDSEIVAALQKKYPGAYNDIVAKEEVVPAENVLQRAAKVITSATGIGQQPDPNHPFMSGIKSTMQGLKQAPSMGGYMGAHEVKSDMINENVENPVAAFALDAVSDPESWMGGGALAKKTGEAVQSGAKKTGAFMKSIEKLKGMSKGDTSIPEKARAGLFQNRAKLVTDFENDLSKLPEASHDISENVKRIGTLAEFNPALKAQIDKSPMMQRLIKTPEIAKDLTTKQFQDIRNEFGKGVNYSSGKADSTVRDVLDELRFKQAEPFPEAMQALRDKYGKGIEAFKTVRGKFSKNALTDNIRSRFKNNPEILKDVKTALPEEVFNEIDTLGKHERIKNTGLAVGKGLGLSGVGLGAAKWLFGNKE